MERLSSHKRTSSYPIQSPEYTANTSQPRSRPSGPQTIPDTIRAVKDAQESNHNGRTIVVCLDGTGDKFDGDNSNVVHFVSCLKKHTFAQQVTYYQSGIGTYNEGGLTNGFKAGMDMAVGTGLGVHVRDAYKFLMQNYHDGDRICLFGFSRGAYTVRCLAGMLHKVGLLPAGNVSQIHFAYEYYKDETPEGWKMSAEFKNTFCTDVNVYFVGVWDSVASVGFFPRTLPFSSSPTHTINYFRHAMALDEHRAKFGICTWQQDKSEDDRVAEQSQRRGSRLGRILGWFGTLWSTYITRSNGQGSEQKPVQNGTTPEQAVKSDRSHNDQKELEAKFEAQENDQKKLEAKFEAHDKTAEKKPKNKSDVLEVWFMGAHADVGGGAVANECRHMLSRIPLRWMLRQCFECNTGILFDTASLAEQGLDIHSLYPLYEAPVQPSLGPPPSLIEQYENGKIPSRRKRSNLLTSLHKAVDNSRPGTQRHSWLSEANEDFFDARSPVNDQLVQAKGWWILEIWPVLCHVLTSDRTGWKKKTGMNMGRHRPVRSLEPKMHWTVKHMMEEKRYEVKGSYVKDTNWQVVT